MMIDCPKCGFSQPKDRYCASCGIDIVAYKPAEPTMGEKLRRSWLVQVGLVTLVVIGVFTVIRRHDTSEIQDRLAAIDDDVQSRAIENVTPDDAAASPGTAPPGSSVSSFENRNAVETGDSTFANSQPNRSAADGSAANGTAAGASAQPGATGRALLRASEAALGERGDNRSDSVVVPNRLRISFAEVGRAYAGEIINSTRNLASYGNFSGGVVIDLVARLRADQQNRAYSLLDTPVEHPIRLNQPIIVFKGLRDTANEANIGVTAQLTPIALDDQGVQVQIEISRVLREPGVTPPLSELTFQEQFLIPKESGAFFAGTLPRRQVDGEEARLYASSSVLKVLLSPAYQNGSSEFMIFVEAR